MKNIKTLLIVFGFLFVTSVVGATSMIAPGLRNDGTLLYPADVKERVAHGEAFVFLDVRQEAEHQEGHIENDSVIPLDQLPSRYNELDKTKNLVVYCRSGVRSAKAVAFLREHGFDKAYSLVGGFTAWMQ